MSEPKPLTPIDRELAELLRRLMSPRAGGGDTDYAHHRFMECLRNPGQIIERLLAAEAFWREAVAAVEVTHEGYCVCCYRYVVRYVGDGCDRRRQVEKHKPECPKKLADETVIPPRD